MPSTSEKQHDFMEAVAHSPSFAKKAGVSQKVGRDFDRADKAAGITKTHKGKPIPGPKKHLPERVSKSPRSSKTTGTTVKRGDMLVSVSPR